MEISSRIVDLVKKLDDSFVPDPHASLIDQARILRTLLSTADRRLIKHYPAYEEFNKNRIYYAEGIKSTENLIDIFEKNVKLGTKMGLNDIILKETEKMRIMSWNVRYWTTSRNEKSIDKIADVIKRINPDILLLQEATFGINKHYSEPTDIRKYIQGYTLLSFCNIVPSWYDTVYGNAILIKTDVMKLFNYYASTSNSQFLKKLCTMGAPRCDFNQYAKTYSQPDLSVTENGPDGHPVQIFEDKETRCFIKISLEKFDIICTHIDAYKRPVREKQLEELKNYITRPTLICGDFNVTDASFYEKHYNEAHTKEWEYIRGFNDIPREKQQQEINIIKEKYGWKEFKDVILSEQEADFDEMLSYYDELLGGPERDLPAGLAIILDVVDAGDKKYGAFRPNISSWTNTVVDYAFIAGDTEAIKINDMYTYFTDATDHLPMVIDIAPQISNNVIEQYKNKLAYGAYTKKLSLGEYLAKYTTQNARNNTLYNAQSLKAYDWYDVVAGHINVAEYKFNDPEMQGNWNELSLGTDGVYMASKPENSVLYGYKFASNLFASDSYFTSNPNTGLNRAYVLFTWKFTGDNGTKIFYIDSDVYKQLPKEEKHRLDEDYDILTEIYTKITPRGYNQNGTHDIVELHDVEIVIHNGGIDYNGESDQITNRQVYDKISAAAPKKIYFILNNAIKYINFLNNKRRNIDLIDETKILTEEINVRPERVNFSIMKYVNRLQEREVKYANWESIKMPTSIFFYVIICLLIVMLIFLFSQQAGSVAQKTYS